MSKDGTRPIPAFIDLGAQRAKMGDSVAKALIAVLESGQYILGPQVTEAEQQLAAFCGAKHCISCANGTDALLLALMAERIGPGDAVFVPAFTFVATAEVAVLAGATPVFVDVRRDTFNMDTASLEAAIGEAKTLGLKPRAVIAVDLFGQPADYPRIQEIADAHGLLVMDDAAQGFGASLNGKKVGTLAAYTSTSFYPAKPLGGYGDGGAIFTDNDAKAELLLSLRNHGKGPGQKETEEIGLNSRLDSFQAVVLIEKLKLFSAEIAARQAAAERYSAKLGAVAKVPEMMAGASSVWAQYTIVTDRRDALATACREAGVPTAIHYTSPLHKLTPYRDCPTAPGGLPQAEWLSERVISLPMHGYLSEKAQDTVIDTVLGALGSDTGSVAAE
ncbi:MAG TPA: DegT/DnrJ/EryC1/StrS aminotransferase family protein [Methyloceanibacter sp.]|nr:DegT/DnrJ/EryC1/StrS aminotransferase family protein [Methyloceanibacter sp.]